MEGLEGHLFIHVSDDPPFRTMKMVKSESLCQLIFQRGDHMGDRDKEVEKEILSQQKFTMTGAIGRAAGPGVMKGASPVTRQQQTFSQIDAFIRKNCSDLSGSLKSVLVRRAQNNMPILEKHLDQPLSALVQIIQSILDNESTLIEFVRQVDVHWGETFQERPHFQREGQTPHPEDEYTHESVRESLRELLGKAQNAFDTSAVKKMP
ncbi:hypothetical protein [Magnetococcus sp. PR-3]|uniref:hypothetical protein n=1 Tax=Magnetococcus sp. PR-3 TaxID=3120355 RepID=UPI002FCE543D